MSTGESDYAKRVVELSMQLANSRADVENLRMRIKAVDKEHEQLKKDRADMADRIDAALRHAKAEGMREAAGRICMFCANLDGEWANSIKTDFVRHVHPISGRIEECKAWAIRAGIVELERAAQIERGEL